MTVGINREFVRELQETIDLAFELAAARGDPTPEGAARELTRALREAHEERQQAEREILEIPKAKIRGLVVHPTGSHSTWPTSILVHPDGAWYGIVAWEGARTTDDRVVKTFTNLTTNPTMTSLPVFRVGDDGLRKIGVIHRLLRHVVDSDHESYVAVLSASGSVELPPGVYDCAIEAEEVA